MVSFDVVSLFNAIPVIKACEFIRKKLIENHTLHLRTNYIVSILSYSYFIYKDTVYKQVHGCAMGSPVSPIVANLCMEEIEETAITLTPVPPKIWKRYVDDVFCIIKEDSVAPFHHTLNSIDPRI